MLLSPPPPLAVPASSSLRPPSQPQTPVLSVLQHNTLPLSTSHLRSRIRTLHPPPLPFPLQPHASSPLLPTEYGIFPTISPYLAPGSKAQTISAAPGERRKNNNYKTGDIGQTSLYHVKGNRRFLGETGNFGLYL